MQQELQAILTVQDLDMKMLRLMQLKTERKKELQNIESIRQELKNQVEIKKREILNLSKEIDLEEEKIKSIKKILKDLEAKQSSIKRVEEFNALTKEMSQRERDRITSEQRASDLIDKKNNEEELLEKIKESLESSGKSSKIIEEEIQDAISKINEEGKKLKIERDKLAQGVDQNILKIYMRLFNNKKDRIIVPLEHRTCSGCNIVLTAHHENLVRKGERLVFCEHCSRILYWQEDTETTEIIGKKRRRKLKTV